MLDFITKSASILLAIGGVLTVAVVGVFYVFGIFKKTKGAEDDRLITILQKTVTELEKKVNNQKDDYDKDTKELNGKVDELKKKLDELDRENRTLIKVLQGRDEQTIQFQRDVLAALATAKETNDLCRSTNESITTLCTLLEHHFKTIENG